LPARIERLLQPLPQTVAPRETPWLVVLGSLSLALLLALDVGATWGGRLIAPLVAIGFGL
jgi:hypothetical protein